MKNSNHNGETQSVLSVSGKGQLYIVSTPIGNLGDMSSRAVETLQNVALIAAEDTRHSGKLLSHFDIQTQCWALHEHNEQQQAVAIVERIERGESVALISDAGTPLISDPGYKLLNACIEADIEAISVPGSCALIAALSIAGLPSNRFGFYGFLPAKSKGRQDALQSLVHQPHTLIFYESPHRIEASLADFATVFGGERQAVLVREITKRYETALRGTLAELNELLINDDNQRRGEMVILIDGAPEQVKAAELSETMQWLARELDQDLATKRAAEIVARVSGVAKKDIYRWLVELK